MWIEDLPLLLDAVITREIEERYDLPLVPDGEGPDGEGNQAADTLDTGFCLTRSLISLQDAVDPSMVVVLTNWARTLRNGKPLLDPEVGSSEPDFWKHYDRAQDRFMTRILNRLLPWDARLGAPGGARAQDTVPHIYSRILRESRFPVETPDMPPAVEEARRLMFSEDADGIEAPTPAYERYLALSTALFEAEDALFRVPEDAPEARRASARARVKQARTALNIVGQRRRFEAAQSLVNNFETTSTPEDHRTRLLAALDAAMIDSIAEPGRTYASTTIAGVDTLIQPLDQGRWQSFEVKGDAISRALRSDIIRRLNGIPLDLQEAAKKIHAIRASFCLFTIERNWLDWSFFAEDFWDFSEAVSDGQGGGLLPAIPDGIVLLPHYEVTVLTCVVTDQTAGTRSTPKLLLQAQKLQMIAPPIKMQAITSTAFARAAKSKGLGISKDLTKSIQRRRTVPSAVRFKVNPIKFQPDILPKRPILKRVPTRPSRPRPKPLRRVGGAAVTMLRPNPVFTLSPPKPKPKNPARLSGQLVVTLDDGAERADLVITLTPLNRSGTSTKTPTPIGSGQTGLIPFNKSLRQGRYRLSVFFKGEQIYAREWQLNKGQQAPPVKLEIKVAEEPVIAQAGQRAADTDADDDPAMMINVFGFRARRVPRCPDAAR